MLTSAEFDPIVVDPEMTPQRVQDLLSRMRESAKLDFKEFLNPSDTKHKVELTKHLVAMANSAGGYIVIGVADDGTRRGLSAEEVLAIDEATIRGQVEGYVGTSLDIFVDCPVTLEEKNFGIITVLRSARAPIVFLRDGQYALKGASHSTPMFRKGDVFVRHGSASERWGQDDVQAIYSRVVERERERWLADVLPDIRRLLVMASSATLPQLPNARDLMTGDAETLEGALRDITRRIT